MPYKEALCVFKRPTDVPDFSDLGEALSGVGIHLVLIHPTPHVNVLVPTLPKILTV